MCCIYRFVFPLFHRDNIDISGPAKPGTTRKMLGSPRQLENAVPTSKNPHGVWVWRQKRAAQWWGGLHSPHVLRESWRGGWRWSWWYIWLWKVGPAAAQMKVIYTPGSPHQPLNIWTFTYQREVIFENLRHQNRDQTDASMILDEVPWRESRVMEEWISSRYLPRLLVQMGGVPLLRPHYMFILLCHMS